MSRPSFLESLRNPLTGRIIPFLRPSPSRGATFREIPSPFPEMEGPTVLSSVLEQEWSPARPGGPEFSPPGSPEEEKTPAERIRSDTPPPLQRQYCLERAALLVAMGFPAEEEDLAPPPTIQRRLVFPKGLQRFPPPEEEDEEMPPASKRYRVSTD